MLDQWFGSLNAVYPRNTFLFFTVIAGVGICVVIDDFHGFRNRLYLSAQEFLSHPSQRFSTGRADLFIFRDVEKNIFRRKLLDLIFKRALRLALMLRNDDRFLVRFRSLRVLLQLRLVEHAELIGRYILLLFARLSETCSLHIQENFIHVIELCSETFYFCFEHTVFTL